MKFFIMVTADLTNLKRLEPQLGCDDTVFPYFFKMRCVNCREVTTKDTCVMLSETVQRSDGSIFNLIQKCVYCRKEGYLNLIAGHGKPLLLETAESRMYTPLMMIEYRGYMEPVDFSFGPGWKAESVHGSTFNDIDLTSGNYEDFCTKAGVPVAVNNLQVQLLRVV